MSKYQKIYLWGMPACGKTYWGKALAEKLGWQFWDNDAMIEKQAGMGISDIFAHQGETAFRLMERLELEETATKNKLVVALGGGTPCFFDTADWLLEQGLCLFISTPLPLILERHLQADSRRPLAQGKSPEELENYLQALYHERLPFYQKAHQTIHNLEAIDTAELHRWLQ